MDKKAAIGLMLLFILHDVKPQVIIREVPSDKAAKVGDSESVLKCTVSTIGQHLISWSVDGRPISSNRKVANELGNKFEIQSSYDLVIKNIQLDDGGKYACNQNSPDIKHIGSAELNVYDEIVCPEDTVNKMENDSISLTCAVDFIGDEKYVPEFAWEFNGKPLTSTAAGERQGRTKVITSGISLVALPEMDGGIISCHYKIMTSSEGVMMADRCRHNIVVQYAARKPSIMVSSDEVTDRQRSCDIDEHVTLHCASKGNPAPRYTWTYKQLPSGFDPETTEEPVAKTLKSNLGVLDLGKVNRNHTGVYTCNAINIHNRGIVSSEVTLMVPGSGRRSGAAAGSTAAVAGGVIAGIIIFLVILAVIYYLIKYRKKNQEPASRPTLKIGSMDVTNRQFTCHSEDKIGITCFACGTPDPEFKWSYKIEEDYFEDITEKGTAIGQVSATGHLLILGDVHQIQAGIYRCQAKNKFNEVAKSSTVTIKLLDAKHDEENPPSDHATYAEVSEAHPLMDGAGEGEHPSEPKYATLSEPKVPTKPKENNNADTEPKYAVPDKSKKNNTSRKHSTNPKSLNAEGLQYADLAPIPVSTDPPVKPPRAVYDSRTQYAEIQPQPRV